MQGVAMCASSLDSILLATDLFVKDDIVIGSEQSKVITHGQRFGPCGGVLIWHRSVRNFVARTLVRTRITD